MKRSTVFLTILGISVLLIGAGLVLTLPSQTFFSDSYTAKLYPDLGFVSGYPVGDYFISYIPPGYEQIQFVQYPLTSVNYLGGFLASNSPVNVTAFGILGFPYGKPLFEVDNTLLATYFTDLYSNPLAFGGVILFVENAGSNPAIVIGQSRQYTISLYSNPIVGLGYALIVLGVIFALVGMMGEAVRPEPLRYIPSSVGETISTGLRIWKRIFASTVIPFGLLTSVYLLIYSLGYAYALTNLNLQSSTALVEAYVVEYGLMFLLSFFTIVASGIVIKATSDIIEGKNLTLTQNLEHVLRRSGKMYIAEIICIVLVYAGLILFYVPGIYLLIIFSLILPAIVVTDNGIIESFRTSKMLTDNDKLRTFGLLLATGFLILIVEIPLTIIAAYFFFTQTYLGFGLMNGVPITSQLLAFNLPQILGFVVLGSIILSVVFILSPIIITAWFYSLGGAYEKARDMYLPTKPAEEGTVCSNCKRTIPKNSKFCPYCGNKQR